jgi:hypothetical protein
MRPTVICVTPVWNEAWILGRFLDRASAWADHIVIADQRSEDGSRQIAASHPKVTLVDNDGVFGEHARQSLLLEAARRFPAPRVLVAIDADESLTPTVLDSPEWERAIRSAPGTAIRLPWLNLLPGLERVWLSAPPGFFALVDDGRPPRGDLIHGPRLPFADDAPIVDVSDVGVLHFVYVHDRRMRAKQRWYQCFERIAFPDKRPAELYRQYKHNITPPAGSVVPLDRRWLEGVGAFADPLPSGSFPEDSWHRRILALFEEHGVERFREVDDLWTVDWKAEAERLGMVVRCDLRDPRRLRDRWAIRWLRFAQPRRRWFVIRAASRALQLIGW